MLITKISSHPPRHNELITIMVQTDRNNGLTQNMILAWTESKTKHKQTTFYINKCKFWSNIGEVM